MRCSFIGAAGLCLATLSQAQALSEPAAVPNPSATGPDWALSVGTTHLSAGGRGADEHALSLRRFGQAGSLAVERLQLQRFGQSDAALALDAYPRLWSGAYAHLRYQRAEEAALYPASAWRAELYQNIGQGWEAAVSRDSLGFSAPVQIDGLALAKYWGNFYLRWRHQQVRADASGGRGDRWVLRYYPMGEADQYLEAFVSNGRSDDARSNAITAARSDSKGLVWQHAWSPQWLLKAVVSQSKDTRDAAARERSLSATLIHRW